MTIARRTQSMNDTSPHYFDTIRRDLASRDPETCGAALERLARAAVTDPNNPWGFLERWSPTDAPVMDGLTGSVPGTLLEHHFHPTVRS